MRVKKVVSLVLAVLLFANNAFARPQYLNIYENDSRSLTSLHGMCSVCHINPNGGGPRKESGQAFEAAGFMITDKFIAQFPELFKKPQNDPIPTPESTPTPESIPLPESTSTPNNTIPPEATPLPEITPLPEATPFPPIIKRIKPKKVKVDIQSMISIMGKNFVDGSKALIDDSEVLTTFKSNMVLIIDFILSSIGNHDLKVKNPDGQESNAVKVMAK